MSKTLPTRGLARFASILRELQRKPDTSKGLAARTGANYLHLSIVLSRMVEMGLIRECEWRIAGESTGRVAVYAFDGGERVPRVTGELVKFSKKGYRNTPELMAFAQIIRLLQKEPITRWGLVEATGVGYHTVARMLKHAHEIGLVRVADWQLREGSQGRPSEMWAMGSGVDAKRPAPIPSIEVQRRHRQARIARRRDLEIHRALAGVAAANDQHSQEAA